MCYHTAGEVLVGEGQEDQGVIEQVGWQQGQEGGRQERKQEGKWQGGMEQKVGKMNEQEQE